MQMKQNQAQLILMSQNRHLSTTTPNSPNALTPSHANLSNANMVLIPNYTTMQTTAK